MLAASANHLLKALLVLGDNAWPVEAGPVIRPALDRCEFVIVCDVMPSELSRYADVLLPEVTFAETTGTYTNTERRIQFVRQAIEPQGDSKPAWKILCELAPRLCPQGARRLGDGICPGWDYANTAAIMDEIASLTPLYAGISHARLERGDSPMWPVNGVDDTGTPMLARSEGAKLLGQFAPVG
jgi:predicted molibdopterin-dependent oxidoreductase YjgC